ncbi:hypothetical protein WICPIJ_003759 [Wickerhamomyces pijperi]|uniref:NADP-dependent oxidoreductase domain-containing protein n=1 Tax=Wickerhamomyces pijperi TaxID=599730 RepID=A0A9P8Q991_WICPI|nr:hypothetical protein WICPIJ_003759 [Wickerhamomyces pijperi]
MSQITSFNLSDPTISVKGFGTMSFTWRDTPIPKEIAFKAIERAIEINLPQKTVINGGEFYGSECINLIYIQEFFAKFRPDLRKHSIISIKGALTHEGPKVSAFQSSIDNILKYIPDLDIFEPCRLDPSATLEEQIEILDANVLNGKIKAFTLSEIKGDTLARAIELSKTGVKAAEVEFSMFSRDVISNKLVEVAGKSNVPIIAYSPLSRGVLTGGITSVADIPQGDTRLHLERFQEENLQKNLKLVEVIKSIAAEKGKNEQKTITSAQIALAWIHYQSEKLVNGVQFSKIIPIPSSSSVERVNENFADVQLTETEFAQLNEAVANFEVAGARYFAAHEKFLDQ